MRTVVFQSYRVVDVPPWLATCMESVRAWAGRSGFEYRFYDDRFFDRVSREYRERVAGRMLPMADRARLAVAGELLEEGADRVVWVDADVVVFDPERFRIEAPEGFALVRERWSHVKQGSIQVEPRVNNSVMVFDRDNPFLDFLVWATEKTSLVEGTHQWAFSTGLLTSMHMNVIRLPLLDCVGILSPWAIKELVGAGGGPVLGAYLTVVKEPLGAWNLCGSYAGKNASGVLNTHADYGQVVERFLAGGADELERLREQVTRLVIRNPSRT